MTEPRRRETPIFILFAYGISWSIWLPLLLNARFGSPFPVSPLLHYAAPYGPFISGILTVLIARGKDACRASLKKIFVFPKKGIWYLVGLGTPWVAYGVSAIVRRGIFGTLPGIEHFTVREAGIPESLAVGWLLWIFSFGLGEEAGWRGFLFQHLTQRRTAFQSTLLTGMIWAAWHLPVFFFDENLRQLVGLGVIGWLMGLVSGSLILSWMTLNAGGSVIPAVLWHGTFNTVVGGSNADPFISGFCSMLVVAAAMYLRFRCGPDLTCTPHFKTKEIEQ